MSQTNPAILVLADGTVFRGTAIGVSGMCVGEVVFNTSMTGYQEILTDPSYFKQIVTLTYPHIGNVGVNVEDEESRQVFASGLVIRDLSLTASNWRSTQSLSDYLKANKIVAISDIDTRKLTRILREKGAQNGCIATGMDEGAALHAALAFVGLDGMDLAQHASCEKYYDWTQREWNLKDGYRSNERSEFHVVAMTLALSTIFCANWPSAAARSQLCPLRPVLKMYWRSNRTECYCQMARVILSRAIMLLRQRSNFYVWVCHCSASVWDIRFLAWQWELKR